MAGTFAALRAAWDFDGQRAETREAAEEMLAEGLAEAGALILLRITLVGADEAADPAALIAALRAAGHDAALIDEDDPEIEARVAMVFSPDALVEADLAVAAVALDHGFEPDGWGFSIRQG